MTRPNIVWISTHDINPHLGCYEGIWPGAEYAVTPHLDQLAGEGVRFDQAFAAAPICAPSRSAIMTGCHPTSIGTMHMRTKAVPPGEVRLLSEYFRLGGYYTCSTDFTDFQVQTPRTAFDECSPTAHWRNRPDPEQPFFAAFHGTVTHESQIYLDEDAFAARTIDVADGERHDPAKAPLPPYYPDTDVFRTAWARYSDLITQMDHWAGNLLAQLAEDGLADNTIVVFWSDHGRGMPRGKRWVNESGLREPLIVRWPGRIEPGTSRSDIVHLMDLAPTMLAACGLDVPEHMQGVPLFDSAGEFADKPNEYVFSGRDRMDEVDDRSRTVRSERYRYILHEHPDRSAMQYSLYPDELATWHELRRLTFEEAVQVGGGRRRDLLTPLQRSLTAAGRPSEELYDLIADPHETTNLAGSAEHQSVLDAHRTALRRWREQYRDLGLMDEDDLLEEWRPGGSNRPTSAPTVEVSDGFVVAECDTEGALIAWTAEPPVEDIPRNDLGVVIGLPENDGRHWNMYRGPVATTETPLYFQAWRIGHDASEIVEVAAAVA